MESSFWSYPGTWVGLGITAVMVAGFVVFALALRRTLRSPPLQADARAPASPSSQPTPGASAAPTPSESRTTP